MISRDSKRLVIAGASSLLGGELKALLEESLFGDWDLRLVDEEYVSGTLTEAGGEAALIQTVEEDSFDKSQFIFFAGSPAFTRANLEAASRSGGIVIDLSGAVAGNSSGSCWIAASESARTGSSVGGRSPFVIPSAAAEAVIRLSLALRPLELSTLTAVCFQPVSEAGKPGIEELESQTGQLLSFQSIGKPVFDTQVAYNLLDRFGAESAHKLADAKARIRREISACLGDCHPIALQLLHAPVFYGTVFTVFVKLPVGTAAETIMAACKGLGFIAASDEEPASNVSAAGDKTIQLALPQSDANVPGGWWLWGAADNIRLPASNAVKLAEKLLG